MEEIITEEELQMLRNWSNSDAVRRNSSLLEVSARERDLHHLIPKLLKKEEFRNQVNEPDPDGTTPLHYLLRQCCNLSIFRAMINSGADISKNTRGGDNVLHSAVMNHSCCKEIIFEILQARPDFVHGQDRNGRTPLHYAGEKWIIKTLIERGADPNVRDNEGRTPLHYLRRRYSPSAHLNVYLNYMSSDMLKCVEEDGNSLWHCSSYINKECRIESIIPALLQAGLDPTLRNNSGETPLHCALEYRHYPCIKILLRVHPLLISIEDRYKKYPLELAKNDDYKQLVKWVSLQDSDIVKDCISKVTGQNLKMKISEYFEQCLSDLRKMKAYDVIPGLTIFDLVLKSYLNSDDTSSQLSWDQYGNAREFNSNLNVYGTDVVEVQKRVLGNSSLRNNVIEPRVGNAIGGDKSNTLTDGIERRVGNTSGSDGGNTPASSYTPIREPSSTQVRAGELRIKVEPTDSSDPGENGVKRKRTSDHVSSDAATGTVDDEEYKRIKRKREEKEHEMTMKVLEVKLKAEQEKLNYYSSLRNSTRDETD